MSKFLILANQIQGHIKNIIHPDQVSFSSEYECFDISNCIPPDTRTQGERTLNHFIREKKAFDKIQHLFMTKVLENLGTYLNVIKPIYSKITSP